jgi:Ca2+-binding EF-hand superfamily protein
MAPQMVKQADTDGDQKLSLAEFTRLADTWYDKLDTEKSDKISQEQLSAKFQDILPTQGGQPSGGPMGGGPNRFAASSLFTALDANKDGSIARAEMKEAFNKWFAAWDAGKAGNLKEEQIRDGLRAALPRPNFGPGGPGGGGGPRSGGVSLDPLVNLNDTNKPLISKLLAVPELRTRYLQYVRDVAEKWLDWKKIGPIALQYQASIAEDVKIDTRKIYSTEAFLNGVATTESQQDKSLQDFVEKRQAFLIKYCDAQLKAK